VAAIAKLTELALEYPEHADEFNAAIEEIKRKSKNNVGTKDANENEADVIVINGDAADVNDASEKVAVEPVFFSGRVIDIATGEAVQDFMVIIINKEQRNTKTDINGHFSFAGDLAEGLHAIDAKGLGYLAVYSENESPTVMLSKDRPVVRDIYVKKGCIVEVEVFDADGNAVNMAEAMFWYENKILTTVVTDSNAAEVGNAVSVGTLEPSDNPYELLLTVPGYAPAMFSILADDVNAIDYAEVVLGEGEMVNGYLYYADGKPAAGLNVCYRLKDLMSQDFGRCSSVEADGYFELKNIIEGAYSIRAVNDIDAGIFHIADMNLVGGESLDLVINRNSYDKLGTIAGAIIYDSNLSDLSFEIGMIKVTLISMETGRTYLFDIKFGQKEFEFQSLQAGTYTLLVQGLGVKTLVLENVSSDDKDLVIQLEIAISPLIRGSVINSKTGEPVESFKVKAVRIESLDEFVYEGKSMWNEFNNTGGNFEIESYGVGIYELSVWADGFEQVVSERFNTATNPDEHLIIKMSPID